jgi:hypothetical protein
MRCGVNVGVQASTSKHQSVRVARDPILPGSKSSSSSSGGSLSGIRNHVSIVVLGPSATRAARVIMNVNDFKFERRG